MARRLGFEAVAANSLDASSDRDFVLEFAFVLALIAEHLSTWAEEWILWSTVEFDFLKLPQAFCTGSSIMPQKVNPDVLELIRGKTARVIGNLQTLLVLVKGLPLAYNRDLQEDKLPLFDAFDTVRASLGVGRPAGGRRGAESRGDRRAARSRASRRHDADGIPDSPRHSAAHGPRPGRPAGPQGAGSGRAAGGPFLGRFPARPSPAWTPSVYDVLGPEKAVAAMQSYGSTGPAQVREQVAALEGTVARTAGNDGR